MKRTGQESVFAVHWLNNKALTFGVGAERLLGEALALELQQRNSRLSPSPLSSPKGRRESDSAGGGGMRRTKGACRLFSLVLFAGLLSPGVL